MFGRIVLADIRSLTLAAAIIGTTFGAQPAFAATVTYTGYSVVGDTISITTPRAVTGTAGQITLTGVTGLGPSTTSITTWCLEIAENLLGAGTFTSGSPLPPPASNLIGGLMVEGNNYVAQAKANGNLLTINGQSYNTKDISAAAQVAIWKAEYGATFAYSSISTTATALNFNALVSYLTANAAPNVAYWTLNYAGNQNQGYIPVPGPLVGAGFPGLILAAAGLLAWARRKTRERETVSAVA